MGGTYTSVTSAAYLRRPEYIRFCGTTHWQQRNMADTENPTLRQSGRTTRQMLAAPQQAVYVWVSSQLLYPRRLAEHLGRKDLWVVAPTWLTPSRVYGYRPPVVVVDHAVHEYPQFELSREQQWVLDALRSRQRG